MRANSIIMKLEKAEGEESEYDFERSKFFGSPVFNKEVIEKEVDFNEIFIAQINLEDIGYYDKDKMLPKTGSACRRSRRRRRSRRGRSFIMKKLKRCMWFITQKKSTMSS